MQHSSTTTTTTTSTSGAMMAPGMMPGMAPMPMMGGGAAQEKEDPCAYVNLNNEISCFCRFPNFDCLGCCTAPLGHKIELSRIPNATCNMQGCNNKAFAQCEGDLGYKGCCGGRCGPVFWRGCGRTLCAQHTKYYNWMDGENHITCCDLEDCAGAVESKKWHNYCCLGCFCCYTTCLKGMLHADKRKCTPEGNVVNR